jgi:hypothetical protein
MKLNVKAMALTFGIIWGLGLFILTWWIIFFDGASTDATFIGKIYRGYTITPLGSVIGLAWGLVDGACGGAIFAWLYNLLCPKGTAEVEGLS